MPIPTAPVTPPSAAEAAPATAPSAGSGAAVSMCLYASLTLSSDVFELVLEARELVDERVERRAEVERGEKRRDRVVERRLEDLGDDLSRIERLQLVDRTVVGAVERVEVGLRQQQVGVDLVEHRVESPRAAWRRAQPGRAPRASSGRREELVDARRQEAEVDGVQTLDEALDRVEDVAERARARGEADDLRVEVVDELLHFREHGVHRRRRRRRQREERVQRPGERAVDHVADRLADLRADREPVQVVEHAVGAGVGRVPLPRSGASAPRLRRAERRLEVAERLEREAEVRRERVEAGEHVLHRGLRGRARKGVQRGE